MSENQSAVDFILEQEDDFDPSTVHGYEERAMSGEFDDKTPEQVREILLAEAEIEDYRSESVAEMMAEDARNDQDD